MSQPQKAHESDEPIAIGIDSETYKGYATLLCASTASRSLSTLIHADLSPLSTDECLHWLLYDVRKQVVGSKVLGFFYNISFDVNAILKQHFVDVVKSKREIKYFLKSHRLTVGSNSLFYIPNKSISFRTGELGERNRNYLNCFDISNFTRDDKGKGTLEQSAQSFLGMSKLAGFTDKERAKLNVDKDFWFRNEKAIAEYCERDSILTAKLAQTILESIHTEHGFWLNRLNSNATIIKAWFSKHYGWMKNQFIKAANSEQGWFSPLGLNERQMKIIAHSYYGGMFDTWRFGRIKHVKKRDIVSAYPSAIARLPRLDVCSLSSDGYHDNAVAGFYKIKMKYSLEYPMPFRYGQKVIYPKMEEMTYVDDRNIYPVCDDQRTQYVTLETLQYLLSKKVDLEIVDSVEWLGKYVVAFPLYRELFNRRQGYKEKLKDCKPGSAEYRFWNTKQYLTKIAMNSGYGMLAEVNHGATQFTNLAYASIITSSCRLMILKAIEQVGLKNVVSLATDSIQFTGDKDVSPLSDDLGCWSKEYDDAEVVTYQNGIQIIKNNNLWEVKARGVPEKVLSAQDFLKAKGVELKYSTERAIRLLPALIINNEPHLIENINVFKMIPRSINLADNTSKRYIEVCDFETYNKMEVPSEPIDLDFVGILKGVDFKHYFMDIPKVGEQFW